MKNRTAVRINLMPTGVPGLDDVLGGGIPEFSFNLIAGEPGAGKTTLAQQIVFANATLDKPALYFTVLGEPPLKMLRYQQQYTFFDAENLSDRLRFVNLTDELLQNGLEGVLERIIAEVDLHNPSIVVVDSFRTLVRSVRGGDATEGDLQSFVQRLAIHLTSWQVTSFLIGEYSQDEGESSPIFTIADGILWLAQEVDRNSVVRKLHIVKVRGSETMPGLHTFRITSDGVRVFPRIPMRIQDDDRILPKARVSMGVLDLDEMMGGGIPAGDSVLVVGPSGSGKTVLATQFIAAGVAAGEPGVLIVFEEHPTEYLFRADALGFKLGEMMSNGMLEAIYLRPLDLSPDETLHEIREAAARVGARRVVIDSMSGFELALAPTFRQDFRESLYRLIGSLTGAGITVLTTMELAQSDSEFRFTPNVVSFLADDIILLRYVEFERALRRVLTVGKMRGSQHSKLFREYEITDHGLELRDGLDGYSGRISGAPQLTPTN
ncbi:MAG: ATPase domain-containing protein [Longimicrobiales bacterium]